MITLRKGKHFCALQLYQDLLGTWHVTRRSGCSTWPSVNVKNFEYNDEFDAKQKLFDLEMAKRKLGFQYD